MFKQSIIAIDRIINMQFSKIENIGYDTVPRQM